MKIFNYAYTGILTPKTDFYLRINYSESGFQKQITSTVQIC